MAELFYREAALADGKGSSLQLGIGILVRDGRIAWIGPDEDSPEAPGAMTIDAAGSTAVPGMVDSHSHLTMPGGGHWIDRGFDDAETLLSVAEHNAQLLTASGVRWARDVGAPRGVDPHDGVERSLSLGVRDRWRGRPLYPYVRAAGTWIATSDYLPGSLAIEVEHGDQLVEAVEGQLEEGSDLVKLYLDGPEADTAPFTTAEVRAAVETAHARGARVSAHSTNLAGARVAAEAAVDSIEHGMELDEDVATIMADNDTALVATLTVMKSWLTFSNTTAIERFTDPEKKAAISDRLERAMESVRHAQRAGVMIATGTDFGGGSARANQLAWEVESLVEAGLEPWQALAAATRNGGELLGEPSAGVIEVGGKPDFFLVHGDPTTDPSALWRVWRVAWVDAADHA